MMWKRKTKGKEYCRGKERKNDMEKEDKWERIC